jgi:MinD-like ATPase involved in chromosome partitioning or flagellar assembly
MKSGLMFSLEKMNDQAQGLRLLAGRKPARVLPILGNTGDPEQAPILAHLAMSLTRQGQRVLIMDAGRVLLGSWFGIHLRYGLNHWLNGECEFAQILKVSDDGIGVMSAASGLERIHDSPGLRQRFTQALSQGPRFDLCLAVGPHETLQHMLGEALGDMWMVSGTQAMALNSTFSRIKGVKMLASQRKLHMIYGGVYDPDQCEKSHCSLAHSLEKSGGLKLAFWAAIAKDKMMQQAILERRTVFSHAPNSAMATTFDQIASAILECRLAPWPWPEVQPSSGPEAARVSVACAALGGH